jgi:hypothetical protein
VECPEAAHSSNSDRWCHYRHPILAAHIAEMLTGSPVDR